MLLRTVDFSAGISRQHHHIAHKQWRYHFCKHTREAATAIFIRQNRHTVNYYDKIRQFYEESTHW